MKVECGAPIMFVWKGVANNIVEIADQWKVRTHWWTEDEVRRHYFRVMTEDNGVYDLYEDGEGWILDLVID